MLTQTASFSRSSRPQTSGADTVWDPDIHRDWFENTSRPPTTANSIDQRLQFILSAIDVRHFGADCDVLSWTVISIYSVWVYWSGNSANFDYLIALTRELTQLVMGFFDRRFNFSDIGLDTFKYLFLSSYYSSEPGNWRRLWNAIICSDSKEELSGSETSNLEKKDNVNSYPNYFVHIIIYPHTWYSFLNNLL